MFNNLSHNASIPAPKNVLAFNFLASNPSIQSVANNIIVIIAPIGAPLNTKMNGSVNAPINLVHVIKLIGIIFIKSFLCLQNHRCIFQSKFQTL